MSMPPYLMNAVAAAVQAVVAGKVADPRIIIVGDSITQFGTAFVNTGAATFSRDATGLVSVTVVNHALTNGMPFSIVNAPDPEFEGLFVAQQVVGLNDFKFQTAYTSAKTMVATAGATAISRHMAPNAKAYFRRLNGLCGGGLRLLANFGAQSDRADMMTNLVTIAANNPDCDIVCEMAGTNDVFAAEPPSQIIADLTNHANIVLAAGKKFLICSIPPDGATSATVTRKNTKEAVNAGLAELAAANPGKIAFANAYPALVDPASPIGQCLPGVTYDDVHLAHKGAYLMAPAVKSAIDELATYGSVYSAPVLGHTLLKSYISSTGADIGTKGVVTGPVAIAGFSNINNARTTCVAEVIFDAARGGYVQRYTITPGGADNLTIYLGAFAAETLASLGCAVGDSLILASGMRVSGGTVGVLRGLTARLGGYNGEPDVAWSTQANNVPLENSLTDYEELIVSAPVVIQPGQAKVAGTLGIAFHAAGAPVVLEIDRVHLLRKPA